MKVGDLVMFIADMPDKGDIGLVIADDAVDGDGLYQIYFPSNVYAYWFDLEDVKVISTTG